MPLALAVNAQVLASFLKGGLHRPTPDEVEDDLAGFQRPVSRKECLGFAAVFGVAHQHPANRHRRLAPVIPYRGAAGQVQPTDLAAIPPESAGLPTGAPVLEPFA